MKPAPTGLTTMTTSPSRFATILTLLAGVFVIAGCGGGGASGSAAGTGSTTPPGTTATPTVTVALTDGSVVAGTPVKRATGHASRPLTEQQLYDKFADCLDVGGSEIPADVLFKRFAAIQSISARELTAHL